MANRKAYICCVTKQGRAVLFGYCDEEPKVGEPVTLYDARMILRWAGAGGLFGVAAEGPHKDSRITVAVPKTTADYCAEFIECTPEATEALSSWD